ncbi:hypothetical protein [Erwinia mallotivora]|uniref:Integrase n=1 Tax=Erwinia mallotivora TaxID=69222 RepID=A0A014NR80_9GAMM|nr:hypothetical protein [Erwinia mallotivora]EXU76340.1 integrase [Erwinia mallotivora]
MGRLSSRGIPGYDVAGEKQECKASTLIRIKKKKNARDVYDMAPEYREKQIVGHCKHPDIIRRCIENNINPHAGKIKVEDTKPEDID